LPWLDTGGTRRFGPVFYADVFAELGIDVIVRSSSDSYDLTAFQDQGIEVEDLPLDSAPPTLAQIDRFISLVRQAPGVVAVHGGPGGLEAAATLIAVWLISAHHFRAAEAVAWVRMAHPAALPTAHQRFLQDTEERLRRRQGLERMSRSFNQRVTAAVHDGGDGGRDIRVANFEHDSGDVPTPAGGDGTTGATAGKSPGGGIGEISGGGIAAGPPRSVAEPRIFDFLGGGVCCGGEDGGGCGVGGSCADCCATGGLAGGVVADSEQRHTDPC
jgi:hypothetical protein